MLRDLVSNVAAGLVLAPAAAINADATGAAVATKGARGLAFVILTGAHAGGGSFAVQLEESEDNTAWTPAPTNVVQGAGVLSANGAARVGYVGYAKYVRPKLVKTGTATLFATIAVVTDPQTKPAP